MSKYDLETLTFRFAGTARLICLGYGNPKFCMMSMNSSLDFVSLGFKAFSSAMLLAVRPW